MSYVLLSTLGSDFLNYIELPATGASGGILVAWRHHIGSAGAHSVDANSVSIQFCLHSGSSWWLTCVYGPQGANEKNSISTRVEGYSYGLS